MEALGLFSELGDRSFMGKAACRGCDPDLWFPERGQDSSQAKKICDEQCPVERECLEYAVKNNILVGIWGGQSSRQRRITRYGGI